jgi:chlorobactene glucosyltransferase
MFVDVFNYSIAAIMIGVAGAWISLLRSMVASFRNTPLLDVFPLKEHETPKVSIILPARNEEEFIATCLDSLLDQNYENYEIIAIDDSSEDATGDIIAKYATKDKKVVHVSAGPKPDGWMGKNWACMEGYRRATGDLLLFTDSDTKHSPSTVRFAVSHLISLELDALTVIPKMNCLDSWTKITLPVLSTFLHTRFSALRVNDPTKKTGYFFGSFFIMKKSTYEQVGMHEGVKGEIIEDGALGKKVKESGFKMRMVRGDHLVDAVWARSLIACAKTSHDPPIPSELQNCSRRVFCSVVFAFYAVCLFGVFCTAFLPLSLVYRVVLCGACILAAALCRKHIRCNGTQDKPKIRYTCPNWKLGSSYGISGWAATGKEQQCNIMAGPHILDERSLSERNQRLMQDTHHIFRFSS